MTTANAPTHGFRATARHVCANLAHKALLNYSRVTDAAAAASGVGVGVASQSLGWGAAAFAVTYAVVKLPVALAALHSLYRPTP